MLEPDSKQILSRLGVAEETISDFCTRHRITEFSLFGSSLRDDFRPDSDVDVIVDFEPGAKPSGWGRMELKEELQQIFGREVDLLTRWSAENMRNPYRKRGIVAGQRRICEEVRIIRQ